MENATQLHEALQAWVALGDLPFGDCRFMEAENRLVEVVKAALLSIECVDAVTYEHGSAGSIYFECWSDASEDHTISIKVRVSNHDAGRRGCENAANIVAGDPVKEIDLQLEKAAKAMAEEISFVLC